MTVHADQPLHADAQACLLENFPFARLGHTTRPIQPLRPADTIDRYLPRLVRRIRLFSLKIAAEHPRRNLP